MFWKRTTAILLSFILIISSFITYPVQAAAAQNSYLEEFYSNPNNLLSLLPPFDSYQPIGNQAQSVTPPLPNTSPEIPNNDVSPRKEAELPPPGNSIPEIPVNVETGYLEISEKDIFLREIIIPLEIKREYSSHNEEVGPFGKGWETLLDSRLQMYADFAMGEFRQDGTIVNYEFVKDDPEGFITIYDDDEMTNYELHKGHYKKAENGDKLTRISQFEYVVEKEDKTKITYYGYFAPWRKNQDPKVGKMTKLTDRYGNSLHFSYDNKGRVNAITDSFGRKVDITWSGDVITELINPKQEKISFSYEGNRLKRVDYPGKQSITYSYDSNGRINGITNGEQEKIIFTYDSNDRVKTVKDNQGKLIFSYNYETSAGKLTKTVKTNALQEAWTYTINNDKVTKVINPLQQVTTFQYNDDGKITEKVSATGKETFTYDSKNRLKTKTDIFGVTTTYQYKDPFNIVEKITSTNGESTVFTFDQNGNIVSRTENGINSTYEYNAKGQLLWVKDALNQTMEFSYDSYGNLDQVKNAKNEVTKYDFDILDRITGYSDYLVEYPFYLLFHNMFEVRVNFLIIFPQNR